MFILCNWKMIGHVSILFEITNALSLETITTNMDMYQIFHWLISSMANKDNLNKVAKTKISSKCWQSQMAIEKVRPQLNSSHCATFSIENRRRGKSLLWCWIYRDRKKVLTIRCINGMGPHESAYRHQRTIHMHSWHVAMVFFFFFWVIFMQIYDIIQWQQS